MYATTKYIADLINNGIEKAFGDFANLTLWNSDLYYAPEYYTVAKIADSLKKLENKKVYFEQNMGELHNPTLGRPLMAYGDLRRYDLAILEANGYANTAIEIKRNVYRFDEFVKEDFRKLKVATSDSSSDSDFKQGIFAFHTTQYEGKRASRLVEAVDRTCVSILEEARKFLKGFEVEPLFIKTKKFTVCSKLAFGGGCIIVKP